MVGRSAELPAALLGVLKAGAVCLPLDPGLALGTLRMAFLTSYTSSKFAIRGFTKAAALELGSRKIRVNSVHPGMTDVRKANQAGIHMSSG